MSNIPTTVSDRVLSLGVLCHNEEASIERMLASVMRQSLWRATPAGRRQIVVCANGCTDGTAAIVRRVAAAVPELELIELNHAGKSQSWNVLRSHLRTDAAWWFFADADVLLHWRALERMADTAEEHPESSVIASLTVSSARFYPSARRSPLIAARVESERLKPPRREVSARLYAVRRETAACLDLPAGLLNEDQYLTRLLGAERIWRCRNAYVFFREPTTVADLVRYQVRTRIGSFQARRIAAQPIDSSRSLPAAARRAALWHRLSWRARAGKIAWLPLRLYVEWQARHFDPVRLRDTFWMSVGSSKLPPLRRLRTPPVVWSGKVELPLAPGLVEPPSGEVVP